MRATGMVEWLSSGKTGYLICCPSIQSSVLVFPTECAQYVDDIGIAAKNATDLTWNIRAVFKCIRQAGLKLTIEKCHFGVKQVEFLGRTISSEVVLPQSHKIQSFLNKLRFPKSKKALQRYLGCVNYYRNYIPRMAEKLNPFYKLLNAEVPMNITSELRETFI